MTYGRELWDSLGVLGKNTKTKAKSMKNLKEFLNQVRLGFENFYFYLKTQATDFKQANSELLAKETSS